MKSIKRQLTREVLAAVLLLLGGGLTVLFFVARKAAIQQFDAALEAKARAISTLTTQSGTTLRVDFTDRFLPGFEDYSPRDFFQVWDESGREVARSESLPRGRNLPRGQATLDRPLRWDFILPGGQPGRAIAFNFRPRGIPGQPRGNGTEVGLVVASDRRGLDRALWELLGLCGGLGLLQSAATVMIIPRVLRRGLAPLDLLGERAAGIDARSLGTRFPTAELPAELQPIALRLNEVLGRLEESFERERRFSADLAHEMRTPLAELRSMAECALKWPESRDPGVDRETLAIARQMEQTVTHILALARSDQQQLEVRLEPVELVPFVERICAELGPRARERELAVVLDLVPAALAADATLLRSIINNLCENAVEYATAGTTIRVAAAPVAGRVVFRIANDTGDLHTADLPRLFDRFWRKDAARGGGTHSGLGLSLARVFAEAMGWSLEAELRKPGRVEFILSGPASASGSPPADKSAGPTAGEPPPARSAQTAGRALGV